jgi:hypothetical protein
MKTRLFVALLIVLVAMMGVVYAQELNPCFSLSEDDCALIGEASLNTATFLSGVESFSVDVEMSLALDNVPDSEPISFDVSGTIDIIMNANATVGINAYGLLDVAMEAEGDSMEAALEFWIVDDVFYFINPDDEGLYSIDLAAVMEEMDFESLIEDAASNPTEALGGGMLEEEGLEALTELLALPGLLDFVRDGDDFIFTVDFGVLADPENEEVLEGIAEAIGETDPATGAQLESMLPMLPLLLEEGTITFTQGLNTELNIVDSITMEMNFVIATGMMMGEPELPSTTFDFLFGMNLGNFDGAENPEAPEGAEDITEDVLEGIEDSMGN